jgi:hypothetical protein
MTASPDVENGMVSHEQQHLKLSLVFGKNGHMHHGTPYRLNKITDKAIHEEPDYIIRNLNDWGYS